LGYQNIRQNVLALYKYSNQENSVGTHPLHCLTKSLENHLILYYIVYIILPMPRKIEFDRDTALTAAADVFWRQGYEATSIDDLTAHTGLGRASLYNSFTDKRGLLGEVVDHYQLAAREQLAQYLAKPGRARKTIELMMHDFASMRPDGPQGCMCINLGLELGAQDAPLRGQVVAGLNRITDTFFALIRRAQAEGDIAPAADAGALSEGLMSGVVSLNALKRLNAPASQLKNIADIHISSLPTCGAA
jgi:TetR/AcrR family transcriptional regulator, transcriptional repressor for nem operon